MKMYDTALLHGGATFSFLNYPGLVQFTWKGDKGPCISVKVMEELCESFFSLVKTREVGIHGEQSTVVKGGRGAAHSQVNDLREHFILDENE